MIPRLPAPTVLHIICPETGDSIGGADLHVLDLAEAQREAGYRVRVMSVGGPEHFLAFAAQRGLNPDVVTVRTALSAAPKLAAASPPMVIHSHGYEADYLTAALRLPAGPWHRRPWVATCHGLIAPDLSHRLLNVVGRACLRLADEVIVVSDVSELDRQTGRPVTYIQNGVRPFPTVSPGQRRQARRELGARGDDSTVLVGYVGRFSQEKRPDLFLQMTCLVAHRRPGVRFVMAGGGPTWRVMADRARHSPIADAVLLTGCRQDVHRIFRALDVLVVPSDTEGTSRVVLEGQQVGLPVVATAVGAIPALIRHRHTGLLVPPSDAEALAGAVQGLIGDPVLRAAIAQRGLAERTRGTASRMAADTGIVYEAALARHRATP